MNFEVKFGKEFAKKVHDETRGWYYGREYYGSITINGCAELCYEYDTSNRMAIMIYGRGIREFGSLTKRGNGSIDAREDIKRMVSTNETIKNLVKQKTVGKLDNLYDNLISSSDNFD